MNKPNVKVLVRGIRVSLDKHAPEILTGMGIAGMVLGIPAFAVINALVKEFCD